jgi:hypothetical protein
LYGIQNHWYRYSWRGPGHVASQTPSPPPPVPTAAAIVKLSITTLISTVTATVTSHIQRKYCRTKNGTKIVQTTEKQNVNSKRKNNRNQKRTSRITAVKLQKY